MTYRTLTPDAQRAIHSADAAMSRIRRASCGSFLTDEAANHLDADVFELMRLVHTIASATGADQRRPVKLRRIVG